MVCVNCGKNLIRGYAFCLDCGSPVPPEVLEEGGMPGRTDDEGRPRKPEAESAPKTESEPEKPVSEVQSSMPGVEPLDGGNSTETLVFCPNCGMHMQSDPYRCNKCGMALGDKPKNVPLSAGGVPLMNVDEMSIGGGLGGDFGGFGEGIGDVSESDIDRINGFMNGGGVIPMFAEEDNSNPDLFGNGISANDFAALSEQLANFSAANEMPSIEAVEREPKKAPSTGLERQVDNFSMSDDGADIVTMTDNAVPVIGNYSMDENPDDNVNLDPYKFLNNSMDDGSLETARAAEPVFAKKAQPVPSVQTAPRQPEYEPLFSSSPEPPKPAPKPVQAEPEPVKQPEQIRYEPIFGSSAPAPVAVEKPAEQPQKPTKLPEPPVAGEAPFIAETAPVISEFTPPPQTAPKPREAANPFGSEDVFGQPVPPRPVQQAPQQEQPRGNMFRCQMCGGTMYDTDKFCPNCGASYKNGTAKTKKKSKAPLFIGIAAALIVLAAGGYFVMNMLNGGGESEPSSVVTDSISSPESSESSSTAEESSEPEVSEETSTSSSTSTAPNSSTGAPPSSTGAPTSSTGAPPSSTGAPSSSTGAPNSSSRPSSTGSAPNSSTGAPSSSTGTPPSSTGAPPGFTAPTSSR